jgi:hypothetical protein
LNKLKPHKSVEQVAKKHRLDVSFVKHQLEMGIPIEHEHTGDRVLATDIALQHLDEIPDYYTRLKKMESSAKKEHKKFKDVKEHCSCEDNAVQELETGLKKLNNTSYDSIDRLMRKIMKKHDMTAKQLHNAFVDKHQKTPDAWINEGTLHHWFKGSKSKEGKPGWVQADGSPCANEPGETKAPKCFSSARLRSLKRKGEKGEALIRSAVRRKRQEDKGQQTKSGAAAPTYVSTFAKGKKDKNYVKAEPGIKEAMELNEASKDRPGKGSGKKDACYNKVKSRYSVWPSAYASGALVKCRKVGAANWGTKSEAANPAQQAAIAINMKKKGIKPKSEMKEDCWDGYKQEGMKKKNKKMVPNCVPVKEASEMIRYCPKCEKDETRGECKYGPKFWDLYSLPINLGKKHTPNTPHPGNFPESYDHEYSMARSELSTIISAAKRLRKKIGKGEGELEAWVQSKITKAADYIDTAADYVDSGEMKEETEVKEKPATSAEKKKIAKMRELHRLMLATKSGREVSDVAKESVSIEDANGNHYAEFIDIIKPEPLKASKGIGSEMLGEGPSFEIGSKKTTGFGALTKSGAEQLGPIAIKKRQEKASEVDVPRFSPGSMAKMADSYEPEKKSFTQFVSEASAAWQRKEGKNPEGGLNKKGIASYRKEHPGSHLSLAVTTKPSKLKPGSKKAKRRKSFCSRMKGMKAKLTSAKTAHDPNSRINKSLRKWNC